MSQETTTNKRRLKDIYLLYDYKKPHEPNITRPSLKGCKMNPNHKLSMTWRQWHEVMKIYLKYVKQYLLSGNQIVLPHHTGVLQLHKKKSDKQSVDWNRFNTTGEYTFHRNNHTGGYYPTFRWYRNKYEAKIINKFHWAAVINRTFSAEISKAIKEDPTLLLSYSTPSNSRKASEAIKPI